MARASELTKKFLHSINPLTLISFTRHIKNTVGLKFTLMLSSNYYITKGLADSYIRSLFLPWYRGNGIGAQEEAIASTIAMMPWSMKGFFGVLSDNFALFGYSKTSYLLIYATLATISSILLAVIPDSALFATYQIPAFMIFLIHCQASSGDLYCEGKYVEKMKEFPEIKGDLVSYVWFCQMIGGFPASLFIGPYTDRYDPKWLFLGEIVFVAQMLPFLISGCMVNDKVSPEFANKWNSKKFASQWKIMTLGILMGASAMTLALMSFSTFLIQAILAIVISLVMCVLVWMWMPKIIGGAIIYLFCTTAFNLGTGGTTTYWLLEKDQDCVANGPQFSYTFLFTISGIAITIFQIIGLWAFQFFLINKQLRTMFWVTNAFQIGTGFMDILLYLRINVAIGISDEIFYLFCGSALWGFFYMMNFMPSNLLIAKMCPKDVEVTVYAILAGFSNFGQQVASYVGTYLSVFLNIETLPPCDYSNFILLMLLITILPILEIPLTFLLIPKGTLDTDFLNEQKKNVKSSTVN